MLYVPPDRNPFLAQSMGLLQNIGLMYLGHQLKGEETAKQQAYAKQVRQEEGQTKMQLAGYSPASGYDQAEGGGVQPSSQVTAFGQAWKRPESKPPEFFDVKGMEGVKAAKFTNASGETEWKIVTAAKDAAEKMPSSDMQVLADLRKTNPKATIEDVYKLQNQFKQPGVSVKVENTASSGETAATKKLGELTGENAGKRIKMAQEGQTQNYQLEEVKKAIEKGASTGFGAETMLDIRRAVESAAKPLGIETKDLSDQELIRKTSNELALRLRNPESGLGLTGNTSNQDLNFLKDSVIGLARTERGNLKIIDSMQRMNKLKVDMAKKQQEIIKQNKGVVPNDLDEKLMDYVDKYPMFTKEERKETKRLSQPIVRYGTDSKGRRVVQFEDGSTEYAN